MAEVNNSTQGSNGGAGRRRPPIKIDMTPMVDLGFLLITFFMLTSVLIKPMVLPIEKYGDENDDTGQRKTINEKKLMTLVLGKDDKVYWFVGTTDPNVEVTDFSVNGIRKILLSKNAEIKDLYVFIKASDQSRYQNLIDILDEMTIADIQRYSLLDVTPEESYLIASLND